MTLLFSHFPRLPRGILAALLPVALAVAAPQAKAEFPEQPLTLVVPFSPGGGTDNTARALGEGMSANLGKPIIVENRAGAGSIIGTNYVAHSKPDGYTMLLATFAHAVNPALYPNLPYDTDKAFEPVAMIAHSPNVLVVSPKLPFHSVQDLLAYAKAHPGTLNYGSTGIGTSAHLAGELLKNLAGINMKHVPYKGAAPALTDLISGQIQVMLITAASATSYVKSGQVRALAVTSAQRSPAFPDLPTLAEAGVPGYQAESWSGIFVPAGTPEPVVRRLRDAVAAAVKTAAFQRQVTTEGLMVDVGEPKQLSDYVSAEEARWRRVVHDAHIQALN
ncbi:MAG TPA: tripartite tricarboxylate transporter substrate binding protein [Bordetella sp.]